MYRYEIWNLALNSHSKLETLSSWCRVGNENFYMFKLSEKLRDICKLYSSKSRIILTIFFVVYICIFLSGLFANKYISRNMTQSIVFMRRI